MPTEPRQRLHLVIAHPEDAAITVLPETQATPCVPPATQGTHRSILVDKWVDAEAPDWAQSLKSKCQGPKKALSELEAGMASENAAISEDLRTRILSEPDLILEDRDLMQALVAANEKVMGDNIVDLRGIAMERLESRLERLEETHRHVIAAAYENLAGTNMVHRAVLKMLDPIGFEDFLGNLSGEIAEILRVDSVRLVLESAVSEEEPALAKLGDILMVADPGFVDGYLTGGRNVPIRTVTLRQVQPDTDEVYGRRADWIRSEACLKLDLGPGRLPGMLVFGAEDPHQFKPTQGTDLLTFFAGVFERAMRRWLA